uniref:RRM domain-containing protein n=1 Tax=Heterorhabditis bacteriophora TaxID=37862 RepID=A0A1I7X7U8_HETBA
MSPVRAAMGISVLYGEVEEINVCENIGEHMVGNVYVKFMREEDADKACKDMNDNRWYGCLLSYPQNSGKFGSLALPHLVNLVHELYTRSLS